MNTRTLVVVTAILGGLCGGLPAGAQQAGGLAIEVPDVRNYAALAIGIVPDYTGSDNYTAGIAPAGKWHAWGNERYIRLLATELSLNILNSRTLSFGPVLNYRFGREDVEDPVIDRMATIDGAVELGIFAGWSWMAPGNPRQRLNGSLQFMQDVSDTHEGYSFTLSARYFHPVTLPLTLSLGASTTYASDNYTSTYFSVSTADSAASGLPVYNAEGGMRDVRISPMAVFSFSPRWHLAGGLIYSRLLEDAADSPIVTGRGSKDQFFAGLGVAYAW